MKKLPQVFMVTSTNPDNDIRVQKEIFAIKECNPYQHIQLVYPKRKLWFPKPLWFILWQVKRYFEIKRTQGNKDWWYTYFQHFTVHCHDLDSLLLGILLKRKYGGRLIFDSHEYYLWLILRFPECLAYLYFRALQFISQRYVDHLIVISDTMKKYFEARYNFKNIIVVRNTQ